MEKSPPLWVLGAGAGAATTDAERGEEVRAGWSLLGPSWRNRAATVRWCCYLAAGLAAAATIGAWLVLVLLGCGAVELAARHGFRTGETSTPGTAPPSAGSGGSGDAGKLRGFLAAPALALAAGGGVLASVAWEAFKVGGLSFGGGFVIIPLMQADAVSRYHWMTGAQFLNAVALGRIHARARGCRPWPSSATPRRGSCGGLLASAVAFTVLPARPVRRFGEIRGNARARAFLGNQADQRHPRSGDHARGARRPSWRYRVLAGALVLLLHCGALLSITLLSAQPSASSPRHREPSRRRAPRPSARHSCCYPGKYGGPGGAIVSALWGLIIPERRRRAVGEWPCAGRWRAITRSPCSPPTRSASPWCSPRSTQRRRRRLTWLGLRPPGPQHRGERRPQRRGTRCSSRWRPMAITPALAAAFALRASSRGRGRVPPPRCSACGAPGNLAEPDLPRPRLRPGLASSTWIHLAEAQRGVARRRGPSAIQFGVLGAIIAIAGRRTAGPRRTRKSSAE